ncbi:MAG: hypothetical protein ACYDBJ_25235 [Aggregatilineales bacterium]
MTTSAAYNPPHLPKAWHFAALIGLMLLLSGCIDPSAPPLGATLPALSNPTNSGATPNPSSVGQAPTPIVPPTAAPPTRIGATAPPQALPLAADGLWRTSPVGPEQVTIMFFKDSSGNGCIRYIFRSTIVPHCSVSGQPLALVAGTIQTADGKQHTLAAGRSLNGQVSGVSIEFADGTFQSMGISAGGFALILDGIHKPLDVVPVDQYGNLVGGKVPF